MISKTIGFRGTQHFQTHPYQHQEIGMDPEKNMWYVFVYNMQPMSEIWLKETSQKPSQKYGLKNLNHAETKPNHEDFSIKKEFTDEYRVEKNAKKTFGGQKTHQKLYK